MCTSVGRSAKGSTPTFSAFVGRSDAGGDCRRASNATCDRTSCAILWPNFGNHTRQITSAATQTSNDPVITPEAMTIQIGSMSFMQRSTARLRSVHLSATEITVTEPNAPRGPKRTTLRSLEHGPSPAAGDPIPRPASERSGVSNLPPSTQILTLEEMNDLLEGALTRAVSFGVQEGKKQRSDNNDVVRQQADAIELRRLREDSKLSHAHISRTDVDLRRTKIALYGAIATLLLALAGWLGREVSTDKPTPAVIDSRDAQIERLQRDLDLLRATPRSPP